jgi:hypothetical protein
MDKIDINIVLSIANNFAGLKKGTSRDFEGGI